MKREYLALIVILLSACSSNLTVTRITDNNESKAAGFRYALPIPFLEVCPGAKGTVAVNEVYLPDPENRYAISGKSRLAKHTLNVTVENGLLKKVDFNPDDTAVAAKVAESSGNLAKAALEREATLKAEADKKEAEEEEKRRTDLVAAEKAVRDAEAALEAARAGLRALTESGVKEGAAFLAAKVAVAQAEARLEAAVRELDLVRADQNARSIAAGNAPDVQKGAQLQAHGCVLYRLVQPAKCRDKTEPCAAAYTLLEAVSQQRYDTSVKIKESAPKPALKLFIQGSNTIRPAGPHRVLAFQVVSTVALSEVPAKGKVPALFLDGVNVQPDHPAKITVNGATKFTVELAKTTPAGTYLLQLPLKKAGDKDPTEAGLKFDVEHD